MRGWTLIISFIYFMRFHISTTTLWSPWPITWNLSESKKGEVQPIVHIYLNCSCNYTNKCTPLIRHGYTFIKQIDKKYQKKSCYQREQSVVCRRNNTLSKNFKWLFTALNDLKNTTMIECLKSILNGTKYQTKETEHKNGTANDTISQHSTLVHDSVLQNKKADKLHNSVKERREQRSTIFAAVIISLAVANTVLLVLLAICLILYINLKPKDEENTNAKARRRKRSSIKQRRGNEAGKIGEEHLTTSHDEDVDLSKSKEHLTTSHDEDVDLNKNKVKKKGIQLTVIQPTKFNASSIQPNANDQDLKTAVQSSPDMNNIDGSHGAGGTAPRSTVLEAVPKESLQMPAKSSFAGVRQSPAKSVFSHLPWFQPKEDRSVFAAGNLRSEHAFQ